MTMTSRERILTTLSHKEPDRVPLILNPTMHPARDLDIPLREYFKSPELVAQGLITSREKFGTDAYIGFHYTPVEYEAFGGNVIFRDDGPPNSGRPVINTGEIIDNLQVPNIHETPCLQMVLDMIRILKATSPDDAPIFGVALSPLSLPVMQMGFEDYIKLIYTDEIRFQKLIAANSRFFLGWATAQIEAGADGIIYYDPVSSPTIIPHELYRKTGLKIAQNLIPQVPGPVVSAFASARVLPIIDDVLTTGTIGVAVWAGGNEDLNEIKVKCSGKLTIIGNLNGIEMRHWTREQVFSIVKRTIRSLALGGGFIMSDNHGEIPLQVPDEVLYAIRDATREYGGYPISV
ncbi:uroporphyrinogen decarboxylase family protein [Methanospirillum lacunae]|nr:uroporphyrinogen decarboxylase family protein [Methanospirillum lacunae]